MVHAYFVVNFPVITTQVPHAKYITFSFVVCIDRDAEVFSIVSSIASVTKLSVNKSSVNYNLAGYC